MLTVYLLPYYSHQGYLQEALFALPLAMEGSALWKVELRRRIYGISVWQIEAGLLLIAIPRLATLFLSLQIALPTLEKYHVSEHL